MSGGELKKRSSSAGSPELPCDPRGDATSSPSAHPLDEIVERANFATIVCNYFGTAFLPKALCVQLEDATRQACEEARNAGWDEGIKYIESLRGHLAELRRQLGLAQARVANLRGFLCKECWIRVNERRA